MVARTIVEVREQVYNTAMAELHKYREWLLQQSPEEVLNHAYEYVIKSDIVDRIEFMQLSFDQCHNFLHKDGTILDDIYNAFNEIETDHMDDIKYAIEQAGDSE